MNGLVLDFAGAALTCGMGTQKVINLIDEGAQYPLTRRNFLFLPQALQERNRLEGAVFRIHHGLERKTIAFKFSIQTEWLVKEKGE